MTAAVCCGMSDLIIIFKQFPEHQTGAPDIFLFERLAETLLKNARKERYHLAKRGRTR